MVKETVTLRPELSPGDNSGRNVTILYTRVVDFYSSVRFVNVFLKFDSSGIETDICLDRGGCLGSRVYRPSPMAVHSTI